MSFMKAAGDVNELKAWKAERFKIVARRLNVRHFYWSSRRKITSVQEGKVFINLWETRENERKCNVGKSEHSLYRAKTTLPK